MTCKDGHCNHDVDGQIYIGHLFKDSEGRVYVDGVPQMVDVHCCWCGRVAQQPSFDPAVIAAKRPSLTFTRPQHGALA